MHFTTMTGAALALTASLASATPITKRQSTSPIDPSHPFQIVASSIPATGTNSGITFTLTSYFTSTNVPNTLALRAVQSSDEKIANFTLDQSQLILYAAPLCEDPNGGCAASEGYGDVYPNDGDSLSFQSGPYSPTSGGFAINNDNEVVVPEDTNAVQFYMCQKSQYYNVLTYEATDSNCTPVKLVVQQ